MKDNMKKTIEMVKKNQLNEDDYFEFGCLQCGECCRNRHDILLNPYDLFRIAKYLKKTISDVIDKYCEVYIGKDSKMPVVRAKPKIYNDVCPFLRNGKCSIHDAKPTVCALFPLGRAASPDGTMKYFIQDVNCGANRKPVKVKDWIDFFHLKESEEPSEIWSRTLVRLYLGKRKYKIKQNSEEMLNTEIYENLYLKYNTDEEFLPQFERNIECVEKRFQDIVGKSLDGAMKGVEVNAFFNTCSP